MFKTRKTQMVGSVVLVIAAALITLAAIKAPAPATVDLSSPPRPDNSSLMKSKDVPVASHDLVKYYQEGLARSYQIDRELSDPTTIPFNYRQGHWFGK